MSTGRDEPAVRPGRGTSRARTTQRRDAPDTSTRLRPASLAASSAVSAACNDRGPGEPGVVGNRKSFPASSNIRREIALFSSDLPIRSPCDWYRQSDPRECDRTNPRLASEERSHRHAQHGFRIRIRDSARRRMGIFARTTALRDGEGTSLLHGAGGTDARGIAAKFRRAGRAIDFISDGLRMADHHLGRTGRHERKRSNGSGTVVRQRPTVVLSVSSANTARYGRGATAE